MPNTSQFLTWLYKFIVLSIVAQCGILIKMLIYWQTEENRVKVVMGN